MNLLEKNASKGFYEFIKYTNQGAQILVVIQPQITYKVSVMYHLFFMSDKIIH
jgi:hypothetical protein